VLKISGLTKDGQVVEVDLSAPGVVAANPAFDVTPAKYVSGLITELGVVDASLEGLQTIQEKAA